MMRAPEQLREECESMTYGQLINERNRLIDSLIYYENIEKTGLENEKEHRICPSPSAVYSTNLDYLLVVIKAMRKVWHKGIPMVDEDNIDEMLAYVRNVIWKASPEEEDYEIKKKEAGRILYKLVEWNNAEAMNIRGAMYYEGRGEKQDQERAVYWYSKAAEKGSSLAMSNLGYAYFYGNGVEVDIKEAYKYFSMAVQRGEWDAYIMLGDMYNQGLYVPRDCDMALSLYTQCLDNVSHDESNDAYPAALTRIAEVIYRKVESINDFDLAIEMLNRAKEIVEIQIEKGNYYAPKALERIEKSLEEALVGKKNYIEMKERWHKNVRVEPD